MKIFACFFLSFFLSISSARAVECIDASKCLVFSSPKGDVIKNNGGKNYVLFRGDNAGNYSTSVVFRGGRYYITRETDGNDKSFIIVPVDVDGSSVSYSRIIFISLDMMASGSAKHDIWSMSELDLKKNSSFSDFSWDSIYEEESKMPSEVKSKPPTSSKEGFYALRSMIYGQDKKFLGERLYIYPKKIGLNPESINCVIGCSEKYDVNGSNYYGAIGVYPISMTLNHNNGNLSGVYHYFGKSGVIFISGKSTESNFEISEFSDSKLTIKTGYFFGGLSKNEVTGTWRAASGGRNINFFLIPEGV